jgi:hypothetical protein
MINNKNKGENNMNSFDALIDGNVKKKAPVKKANKGTEIIEVPDDIQDEIDILIEAKKAKKIAESDIKRAEPKIIDFGIKLKDQNAYKGVFNKSYKLGNDDNHVNLITANKWSFNEDDVDEIKDLIGDKADEMILEHKDVKLKSEVFSDIELQKKFVEMVGNAFPEFFETVVSHYVSEDFDKKVYELPKQKYEDLKLLIKQAKPSLR